MKNKVIWVLVVLLIGCLFHICYHSINTKWIIGVDYSDVRYERSESGKTIYITTKNSNKCYEEGNENGNIKDGNKIYFGSLPDCNKFLEIIN